MPYPGNFESEILLIGFEIQTSLPASNFVLLIIPSRYFCGGSFCFIHVLVFKFFLCCWRLMYVFIFLVKVTEWPPIGKIAAHSAYNMFHGIST